MSHKRHQLQNYLSSQRRAFHTPWHSLGHSLVQSVVYMQVPGIPRYQTKYTGDTEWERLSHLVQ